MFYIGDRLYSTLVAVIVEGGGHLDMVGGHVIIGGLIIVGGHIIVGGLIIVGGRVSGIVCGCLGG